VLDAPALLPPAVVAPAPREVSWGLVAGTAPRGTQRVVVRVGERVVADRPLRGRRFSLRLDLPARDATLRVTTIAGERSSTTAVPQVRGLPAAGAPRLSLPRRHAQLDRRVRSLTRSYGGVSGVYVQDLASGWGAAWNAAARFPAASTLKLAIAVTVVRRHDGLPTGRLEVLLRRMLVLSENEAANELEAWLGGPARVEETLRALELHDSLMYGGYEVEPRRPAAAREPIPIRVEQRPSFPPGKYSSAWDLGRLARAVYAGAAGKGPLPGLGVTASEARHLLWLLAHVQDRGKLGRYLGASASLLHKAGWLKTVRHDAGIVVWPGGAFVAAVLTWSPHGVGTSADVLAGSVTRDALDVFRSVG
jgi:beta-lactamase class A